jgi:hypothetical protein
MFQSRFSGTSRSWEFITWSQVISWPVYAAIRPMIATNVQLHMCSPSLIGLPSRIERRKLACSF